MKAVSRVHITPHMHWDREWYFTTEESRILLVNNMEEILCRLEQDNEYKYYVLDGQTAILEDYFAVKPENKDRVKKQVEERFGIHNVMINGIGSVIGSHTGAGVVAVFFMGDKR